MKCISCEVEINPKWKHAIDINVCPFCGEHILEEHLKNLLATLADTMEKLQQYTQQINDWMLSNYSYIKTDSPDLPKYLPQDLIKELRKAEEDKEFKERKDKPYITKVKTESGEQEVLVQKIQSEEKTNDFFKRAQDIKPSSDNFKSLPEKTQRLKEFASQIKKAGTAGLTSEAGGNSFITPEMIENADPEAVAEMQALLSGNGIASSLGDISTGEEELPSVVEMMANRAAKNNGGQNAADMEKLQKMYSKVNDSHRNFENGENRSKKGGFSRV